MVRLDNKTSEHVTRNFDQVWQSRYSWPDRSVHENKGESTRWKFKELLEQATITDVPTTTYNLKSTAVCKHMHHTVGNVLWTLVHESPPMNTGNAKDLGGEAVSIAQHAIRCIIHITLGSSPGLSVFNRDMFLNIPLITNWHLITTRREHVVTENLRKANAKRRTFDYAVNQKVLEKQIKPKKLSARTGSPYTINQVHWNGTTSISLREGVSLNVWILQK